MLPHAVATAATPGVLAPPAVVDYWARMHAQAASMRGASAWWSGGHCHTAPAPAPAEPIRPPPHARRTNSSTPHRERNLAAFVLDALGKAA